MSSSYENLSKFLDYRTSNLGMITLTDAMLPNKNIFSYISTTGITINPNIRDINNVGDPTTTTDKEDIIMKTLVFNTDIINNNSQSKDACKYILDTTKKFNIGDFSDNITLNAVFYENNFVRHNDVDKDNMCSILPTQNCDEIIDIDLSYYASQNVIKSMFLLDILIQLYHNISINKDNRESIINNLRNLTIRSRYYIQTNADKSETWKLYNIKETANKSTSYYNITFTDKLFPQERDPNTGKLIEDQLSVISVADVSFVDATLTSHITKGSVSKMISLFNDVILKHINYIKGADMMYSDNFSNFYKLCRLMLNSVILNSISIAVDKTVTQNAGITTEYPYFKSFTQSIPSTNIEFANGDILESLTIDGNNIVKNQSYTTKNGFLTNIMNINESIDNSITIISCLKRSNASYLTPTGGTIENIIRATPSTTPTQTKQKLKLTIDNNKLSKIEGLENKKEYNIILANFSSVNSTNLTITVPNTITLEWNNTMHILTIKAINITGEYIITDDTLFNLYMIPLSTTPTGYKFSISSLLKNLLTNSGNNISIMLFGTFSTTPKIQYNDIITTGATTTSTITDVANNATVSTAGVISFTNNILKIDVSTLNSQTEYSFAITNTTPSLVIDNGIYIDTSFIPRYISFLDLSGSDVFNYIWQYNNKPENANNLFINDFNIVATTEPIITPTSYETANGLTSTATFFETSTKKYYGLNNTENKLLTKILDNLSAKIGSNFNQDTKDNDEIIKSMSNLAKINTNLAKNSNVIKKNYSESTLESSKVLSSSVLFIACVIILIITIFASVYLPISNIPRTTAISISGVIFVIAIVMYVIMKILEKTKYNSYEESFINYDSYKGKINAMIKSILTNLYNERTRISQQVVKPSIKKEEYYFSEKNKKFEIYKGRTYSDLQIISRIRQKNIAKIDCMLEISIIISLSLLLYVLKPEWLNVILGISIILILISIFIMFLRLTNIVQTNAKNKYWTKPDTSLEQLKYSSTSLG